MAKKKKQQTVAQQKPLKKLLFAVSLAAAAGVLILVLQILPAQYGIDPTGFGTYIGLTKRYEDQQRLQEIRNTRPRQDSVEIEVAADGELEYKVYMVEGDPLKYQWSTDEGEVFAELHGELKGVHTARYTSHDKKTAAEDSGEFTAPFEGTHGWYWQNENDFPLTITLNLEGKYNILGVRAAAFSR